MSGLAAVTGNAGPRRRRSIGRHARVPGSEWRDHSGVVSLAAHGVRHLVISYIADQKTDGFIARRWLAAICGGDVDQSAVDELVAVGWWETTVTNGTVTGYIDVRWLDENISTAEWETAKAKNREKQANFRKRAKEAKVAEKLANTTGEGGPPSDHEPNPEPIGNEIRNALPLDSKTPRLNSPPNPPPDAGGERAVTEPEPDPARPKTLKAGDVVEAALTRALEVAKRSPRTPKRRDRTHFAEAAERMRTEGRQLTDVAAEWCSGFVDEFDHPTPKNLALYAETRAANGGQPVQRRPRQAPEAPLAGSVPDRFAAEAVELAARVAAARREACPAPIDIASMLRGAA